MTRILLAALVAAASVGALVVGVVSAPAEHNDSRHENMRLIANYDDGGAYRNGTDIAFWGNLAILGRLDQGSPAGPGGFRVINVSNPAKPRQIGEFDCPGDQSDPSIWRDIVILSVDKPTPPDCEPPSGTPTWEGIRIVSIRNAKNPQLLAELKTDCGSHTNTVYPDLENDRLLVYVLSYPLAGRYNPAQAMAEGCTQATHSKISVVSVPLSDPGAAEVLDEQPSVAPAIGCHDVTVFMERELAAAACLTETQIWDLSEDPAQPEIIGTIRDPRINIHHSTTLSNDGATLVVGDELGGAAMSPGCVSTVEPYGGLFFYDVAGEKASSPEPVGNFKLPQQVASEFCTAHQFNVVPRHDDRDVLISSWYAGATSVIDFTDPSDPEQIAYYIPAETTTPDEQPTEAAAWASYWYNGYVFSNNFDEDVNSISQRSRGLDVFAVDHPLLERGTVRLPRLNPQLQEPLPPPRGGGKK
jgi:hypothetical protein